VPGHQALAEYFVRLTDETEAAVLGALAGRTLADSLGRVARPSTGDGAPARTSVPRAPSLACRGALAACSPVRPARARGAICFIHSGSMPSSKPAVGFGVEVAEVQHAEHHDEHQAQP